MCVCVCVCMCVCVCVIIHCVVAIGNSPPGMVRAKALYMQNDISRLSEYFQIPLRQPKVCSCVCCVGC